MAEYLENCLTGPNFAATILLGIVTLYWLVMIVTGIGSEGLEIDLDVDADVDMDSALSIGGVFWKWLNLGHVPLMVWLSIFAMSLWVLSVSIPLPAKELSFWYSSLLVLRNGALALLPTKLLTQPLKGRFDTLEPNRPEELQGRSGEAVTEVSPAKGQARFSAEGAPLLLKVRTLQGLIAKGEQVTIVDFDPELNMHLVQKTDPKQKEEV